MTNEIYNQILNELTRDELSVLRSAAMTALGYADPGTIGIEPKPGHLQEHEYIALVDILEDKLDTARALLKTGPYKQIVIELMENANESIHNT